MGVGSVVVGSHLIGLENVENVFKDNRALAARLGLSGTPALVVGRTIVSGAISEDDLERLIALEGALPPVCG